MYLYFQYIILYISTLKKCKTHTSVSLRKFFWQYGLDKSLLAACEQQTWIWRGSKEIDCENLSLFSTVKPNDVYFSG